MSWQPAASTSRKLTAWDLGLLGSVVLVLGACGYYLFLRDVPLPASGEVAVMTASVERKVPDFEVPPDHIPAILGALTPVDGRRPEWEKRFILGRLCCRMTNGQSRIVTFCDSANDQMYFVIEEGARCTRFRGGTKRGLVDAIGKADADAKKERRARASTRRQTTPAEPSK